MWIRLKCPPQPAVLVLNSYIWPWAKQSDYLRIYDLFITSKTEKLKLILQWNCFASKTCSVPLSSQAAHYGCGCWAENACNMNPYSTAVSTSGIPQRTLYNLHCSCVYVCVPFLFPLPLMFTTGLLFVLEMIWIRNRYLMWASYLTSVSQASQSLIILSDDLQPFLLTDSHQSLPQLIESSFSALS